MAEGYVKINPLTWLAIAIILVSVSAYVFGQTTTNSTNALQDAIDLYNASQYQQADALFVAVATNSTDYGLAQCYHALCQYGQNDKHRFLETVKSIAVTDAMVSGEIREDLTFKEIDSLLFYRNFEQLLPAIKSYLIQYPSAPRYEAVSEYAMAGLFERGMKKMRESAILTDTNQINFRLNEGTNNLQQFLSLAEAFQYTNYVYLTNRFLTREVWAAGIALGGDMALLNALQGQSSSTLEQFSLRRIALHKMLHRDQTDANLQLMTNYVTQFPLSSNLMRVQFDIADISFPRGEQLWLSADALQKSGNLLAAADARNLAHQYFLIERAAQSRVSVNPGLGILPSDVMALRDDLINGYYLEGKYVTMTNLTSRMLAEASPGDTEWMLATLYTGMALLGQSSANWALAAADFDSVMAYGFTGQPEHDHRVLDAAGWRLNVAKEQGDWPKAFQIVKWVHDSQCRKNQKEAFLSLHSYFLSPRIINGTLYQP